MKKLEELLAEHPIFKGLEAEYIRVIAGCASNVVFQEGEQIFKLVDTYGLPVDVIQEEVDVSLDIEGFEKPLIETSL